MPKEAARSGVKCLIDPLRANTRLFIEKQILKKLQLWRTAGVFVCEAAEENTPLHSGLN